MVLTFMLVIAGCGQMSSDDETNEFWSPFSSQSAWDVGDGRIRLELSGYERGHEPGRAAEFSIDIENRRPEAAELIVCAKLIDEQRIVQEFDEFRISIEPDGSDSAVFNATLDEDLEPRAYGLAVIVGDIGAIIHTVRVGIPDDAAGPWLDADELVCDG